MDRKHGLPLGTSVCFGGDPSVYQTADYQTIVVCSPDCTLDHEHIEEPMICVSQKTTYLMPLSQMRFVFGADHIGHKPTPQELGHTV